MNRVLLISGIVAGIIILYISYRYHRSFRNEVDNLEKEVSLNDIGISAMSDMKVDKTTKINGYDLSGDVNLTKSDIGLDQVDNSSDLNKPISDATDLVKIDKLTSICSANLYLRADQASVPKAGIDSFYYTRGDDTTPAKYKSGNVFYRRIETVDGNWETPLYLPLVSDYPIYSHFYFECNSGMGFDVSTRRSDQESKYSSIGVNNGYMAVFVSTGDVWAYIGQLKCNI